MTDNIKTLLAIEQELRADLLCEVIGFRLSL